MSLHVTNISAIRNNEKIETAPELVRGLFLNVLLCATFRKVVVEYLMVGYQVTLDLDLVYSILDQVAL